MRLTNRCRECAVAHCARRATARPQNPQAARPWISRRRVSRSCTGSASKNCARSASGRLRAPRPPSAGRRGMSPASAWLAIAIIAMMTCARGVRAADLGPARRLGVVAVGDPRHRLGRPHRVEQRVERARARSPGRRSSSAAPLRPDMRVDQPARVEALGVVRAELGRPLQPGHRRVEVLPQPVAAPEVEVDERVERVELQPALGPPRAPCRSRPPGPGRSRRKAFWKCTNDSPACARANPGSSATARPEQPLGGDVALAV